MKKNRLFFLIATLALTVQTQAFAVNEGDSAPDCQLKTFSGNQPQSLKSFAGKVLYVDFWASWCGPCAKSFPFLNDLHQQLAPKGLQIMGVNMDENSEDAKGFLAKFPANFMVVSDTQEQCAKLFEVQAMPSSYLIDKKGKIRKVHLGFKAGETEELTALVSQFLAEP